MNSTQGASLAASEKAARVYLRLSPNHLEASLWVWEDGRGWHGCVRQPGSDPVTLQLVPAAVLIAVQALPAKETVGAVYEALPHSRRGVDGQESGAALRGSGARHQCLAGARGAEQQHALAGPAKRESGCKLDLGQRLDRAEVGCSGRSRCPQPAQLLISKQTATTFRQPNPAPATYRAKAPPVKSFGCLSGSCTASLSVSLASLRAPTSQKPRPQSSGASTWRQGVFGLFLPLWLLCLFVCLFLFFFAEHCLPEKQSVKCTAPSHSHLLRCMHNRRQNTHPAPTSSSSCRS